MLLLCCLFLAIFTSRASENVVDSESQWSVEFVGVTELAEDSQKCFYYDVKFIPSEFEKTPPVGDKLSLSFVIPFTPLLSVTTKEVVEIAAVTGLSSSHTAEIGLSSEQSTISLLFELEATASERIQICTAVDASQMSDGMCILRQVHSGMFAESSRHMAVGIPVPNLSALVMNHALNAVFSENNALAHSQLNAEAADGRNKEVNNADSAESGHLGFGTPPNSPPVAAELPLFEPFVFGSDAIHGANREEHYEHDDDNIVIPDAQSRTNSARSHGSNQNAESLSFEVLSLSAKTPPNSPNSAEFGDSLRLPFALQRSSGQRFAEEVNAALDLGIDNIK